MNLNNFYGIYIKHVQMLNSFFLVLIENVIKVEFLIQYKVMLILNNLFQEIIQMLFLQNQVNVIHIFHQYKINL